MLTRASRVLPATILAVGFIAPTGNDALAVSGNLQAPDPLIQNPPNPLGWPGVNPTGFEWGLPFELRPRVVEGTPNSDYAVSSMRTTVEGWHFKPVYRNHNGWARVVGFLAWPGQAVLAGESPRAIWYERPDVPCAEWASKAFTSGSVWNAVMHVKAWYGIGHESDTYWEIDQTTGGHGSFLDAPSEFKHGLAVDDPLRVIADTLADSSAVTTPGPRSSFLGLLQDSGYPAADIPIERKGVAWASAFLWEQVRYYERVISVGPLSPGEWAEVLDWAFGADPGAGSHGQIVLGTYGPQIVPMPPDEAIHQPCPAPDGRLDCPAYYEGPWYPVGQACNCTTRGPLAMPPFQKQSDQEGWVITWIPFPKPLGSFITYRTSSNTQFSGRLCVWIRTCTAIGERQIRYRLKPDCIWRWGPTHRTSEPIVFERVFTWMTGPNDPCVPEMRPTECPPAEQPCDLVIPVQHVP